MKDKFDKYDLNHEISEFDIPIAIYPQKPFVVICTETCTMLTFHHPWQSVYLAEHWYKAYKSTKT